MQQLSRRDRLVMSLELADLVVQQHGQWTKVMAEDGDSYNDEGQEVFLDAHDRVGGILNRFLGSEESDSGRKVPSP